MLLIAAGMIVGLRVSLTMLAGSILLYFFVSPALIGIDAAHLLEARKGFQDGYIPSIELVGGGTTYHIYRWALWGGTALMVMSSLTSLAFQWKSIGRAVSVRFPPARTARRPTTRSLALRSPSGGCSPA